MFNAHDAMANLRNHVSPPYTESLHAWQDDLVANSSTFERTEPLECLKRYVKFDREASDALFVVSQDITSPERDLRDSNNSLLAFGFQGNRWDTVVQGWPYWECGESNTFNCGRWRTWEDDAKAVKDWNILGFKIEYCLVKSLPLDDQCGIGFDPYIMIRESEVVSKTEEHRSPWY